MAEIGGLGGSVPPQGQNRIDSTPQPVGQPGPLGQPTGMPAPGVAPGTQVMPDVLAGREASQLNAAEQMRARGGASATDELLGLNRQPTMAGAFPPPPGNSEALRHMTPTMRRNALRQLLERQRGSLRDLAHVLRRERDGEEDEPQQRRRDRDDPREAARQMQEAQAAEALAARAGDELGDVARMIDLLDEMLAMQDYAVSQMGTFSQG